MVDGGAGRESPSLNRLVEYPAGDGGVNGSGYGIVDQSQRACRIGHGGIVKPNHLSITHGHGCARELPEALRIVDIGVVDLLAAEGGFVDETKGVEGLVVSVLCVSVGAQVGSEKLHLGRDFFLNDQVLRRRCYREWTDVVDESVS